jgi:hypothetical protein
MCVGRLAGSAARQRRSKACCFIATSGSSTVRPENDITYQCSPRCADIAPLYLACSIITDMNIALRKEICTSAVGIFTDLVVLITANMAIAPKAIKDARPLIRSFIIPAIKSAT